MLEEIKKDLDSNVIPLVRGIAEDAQSLLGQEIALIKSELKVEAAKAKTMAAMLLMGLGLGVVSLLLLCMGLVQLLSQMILVVPVWAWYAILGIISAIACLLCVKSGLAMEAKKRTNPLPDQK